MKTFAAVITGIHLNKQIVTLTAKSKEEAVFRAEDLAEQLREEGQFGENDILDYDVYELSDIPHIAEGKENDGEIDAASMKTLADLIRFSRDTDGELPDRVLARILLDGMLACEED